MKTAMAICASLSLVTAAVLVTSGPVMAQSRDRACFSTRNIRGFASSDNRTLLVRASRGEIFELRLFSSCQGLEWRHRIELRTRSSNFICEGRLSGVEVVVRAPSRGRQRCLVSNVRRLSPEDAAALPSRARP